MNILNELKLEHIDESRVLLRQGYRGDPMRLKSELKRIMNKQLTEAQRLMRPRAMYTELKILDITDDEIWLGDGLAIRLGGTPRVWEGLEYLVVAVCTIGCELEDAVNELMHVDDYPAALMLDSIGSVAVDSVADNVNHLICDKTIKDSMFLGPRLSPGYGTWALSEQKAIFDILPAQSIGVRLTDNYVMVPQKSISFCIGIGKQLSRAASKFRCRHCLKHGCKYRI